MNATFKQLSLRLVLPVVLLFALVGSSSISHAQSQPGQIGLPPGFTLEVVTNKLDGPTSFAFAPDGRIFVTQKAGTVRIIANNQLLPENFIDISQEVNQAFNRGLVGIAVHPGFPQTP